MKFDFSNNIFNYVSGCIFLIIFNTTNAASAPTIALEKTGVTQVAGVYQISQSDCAAGLDFRYTDNFLLFVNRREYSLHRVNVGGDVILSKYIYKGGGTGPRAFHSGVLNTGNGAVSGNYAIYQAGQRSTWINVQCGTSPAVAPIASVTSNPACPVLRPNNLGTFNGKLVCQTKFPTKIKKSKCTKENGTLWSASGTDYCIWDHSNSWHARPTK